MRDDADDWRPGDPLPAGWIMPTACPDGHPWGPGYVSMSYSKAGEYHTYCVPDPSDNRARCRWRWDEPVDGGGGRWYDYRS